MKDSQQLIAPEKMPEKEKTNYETSFKVLTDNSKLIAWFFIQNFISVPTILTYTLKNPWLGFSTMNWKECTEKIEKIEKMV